MTSRNQWKTDNPPRQQMMPTSKTSNWSRWTGLVHSKENWNDCNSGCLESPLPAWGSISSEALAFSPNHPPPRLPSLSECIYRLCIGEIDKLMQIKYSYYKYSLWTYLFIPCIKGWSANSNLRVSLKIRLKSGHFTVQDSNFHTKDRHLLWLAPHMLRSNNLPKDQPVKNSRLICNWWEGGSQWRNPMHSNSRVEHKVSMFEEPEAIRCSTCIFMER